MDDKSIVEMYWERDEKAIEETSSKYGNYCRSIALNILGNEQDADESVNDTYLGVWNSIPPYKPEKLAAYVGRITRNLSLKKWREKNAGKRGGGQVVITLEELKECIPSVESVDRQMEEKQLGELIDAFLRKLPEEERSMFVCRYWYMDTIEDICKQFSCKESKVKMKLLRTRKKLMDRLEKEGVNV